MDNILSVRQLTERLRATLEQKFPYVWVRGEVTNLSRPQSGHIYFSLKEGEALLACVWFRAQQAAQEHFDPLTGEVWEDAPRVSPAQRLTNGQEMICAGRLSVYPARGSYQLLVDMAEETGRGQLHLAFEALKNKLADMGYFAQERKRPLPKEASRIALITAPSGAALQDFLRISADRGLGCGTGATIRIFPSPVQGDDAPARLVAAMEEANAQGWAELIVLIRGGGSIQDLWAFNDERVARAIFASRLPVLTGVGHDIDHSIADFVADLTAATPSHAAQLLWPERKEYAQRVDDMEVRLTNAALRRLTQSSASLEQAERGLRLLSPQRRLADQEERLATMAERLDRAGHQRLRLADNGLKRLMERLWLAEEHALSCQENDVARLELRLEGLSPLAPLERGYALVRRAGGTLLRAVGEALPGEHLELEMHDGRLETEVRLVKKMSFDEKAEDRLE